MPPARATRRNQTPATRFGLWAERLIASLSAAEAWRTKVSLRDERFVRLNLVQPEVTLKVELVNDVPNRVGQTTVHPVLGRLDTAEYGFFLASAR